MSHAETIAALWRASPVILAPMEDVTDAVYRRACRQLGADLCVTEFVRAEQMIARSKLARRKATLGPDDRPTAIQIYGADARLLMEAAEIAAAAAPAYVDVNCGCWVPRIARGGAGAAWLRDPAKMVAMAQQVVAAVGLPVTVKTRIGWGPESDMPIVDLARRLEDVGVAGLTIHCRTAQQGHGGAADWSWARRAREVVAMPVTVNGDVATADDAARALAETGCAAVMIGRAAVSYPWVFREARAWLARGARVAPATADERRVMYRDLLAANVAARGPVFGVRVTRRHVPIVAPLLDEAARRALYVAPTVDEALALVGIAA
ncbi:MAG: tRNA-dihydrouridine synthase family protein [Myxococcales bacterium]|nr:tRNA-dihydrouridine synthase family protein [Myxococcales bacterium]